MWKCFFISCFLSKNIEVTGLLVNLPLINKYRFAGWVPTCASLQRWKKGSCENCSAIPGMHLFTLRQYATTTITPSATTTTTTADVTVTTQTVA